MQSKIGTIFLDQDGSALGIARITAEKSYAGTGTLLKKVIEDEDKNSWEAIKRRVEYTFEHLSKALSALEAEEGFLDSIRQQVRKGKKILFKPNLVSVENIEPYTHLPVPGSYANTEWIFSAAVLRWFHDKGKFRYDQMCLGEAASNSLLKAARYTHLKGSGRPVTSEAAYEGKSDEFYGGWGFYFARRYLAETLEQSSGENPMRGLEESMAGTFIPPGEAGDRLMVYDLNRISDDPSKGRKIALPDGENFKSIILHKVIVGGDPSDPEDCRSYPGSVVINLPKLKVHSNAMFTNAIKNLGIGLYPLQANRPNCKHWEYATPDKDIPAIKSLIPHQVWVPDVDPHTLIPKKNPDNTYKVEKTAGMTGTMLDIIRAAASQDVFMMHIIDAVESVNRDHQGIGLGVSVPEGLIIAGTDVVATDLFCARYMFSNVGLYEARKIGLQDRFGGFFPQLVPVPEFDGNCIRTKHAYDCPLSRDYSITRAEKWGLGSSRYHVKGWDALSDSPLASFKGRLGYIREETFHDIYTRALYWDIYKMPWDLQKTFLGYLEAADQQENCQLKQLFLDAFDETGSGSVTYEENGKKGIFSPSLFFGGEYMSSTASEDDSEMFRVLFAMTATPLRCSDPEWNPDRHHYNREFIWGSITVVALMMSLMKAEIVDQHIQGMTWGKGNWPSFSQARHAYMHQVIYGWKYPKQIGLFSLYGSAFAYADQKLNDREFVGRLYAAPNPKAPEKYLKAVRDKKILPLDFTVFVPEGYGSGGRLPNVKETSDPDKIFTAEFDQGKIQWPSRF